MIRLFCLVAMVGCTFGAPAPPPEPQVLETVFTVPDVEKCNKCAMDARLVVRNNPGIQRVNIDIATGRIQVIHLSDQISPEGLAASLDAGGHPGTVVSSGVYVPEAEAPAAPTSPQ